MTPEETKASVKGDDGLLAALGGLADHAAEVLRRVDPSVLTGWEAERLLATVSRVRNIAAGVMPGLAARVEETGRWRQAEARSSGAHLGQLTGGSPGSGQRLASAGKKLESAPQTKEALAAGRLSIDQAELVAGAVAETASSPRPEIAGRADEVERRLLEVAERGELGLLRDEAARATQAARDEARQRRVQHDNRHLRRRTFDDGSVGGQFKLPAGVGAEVWAHLDRLTDHRFEEQRRAGVREPRDRYAADALCMGLGVTPPTHPDQPSDGEPVSTARAGVVSEPKVNLHKELVVLVDAETLRQGEVVPGGTCEIPGVGPVPVGTARELLGEAGVSLVVKNGVDIANVTLGGRRLSKSMRLAMLAANGWSCADCGTSFRLQGDHDTPFAVSQWTKLDELRPRCPVCHGYKTKREAPQTTAAGRARKVAARDEAARDP